jgi:hypothetical protein
MPKKKTIRILPSLPTVYTIFGWFWSASAIVFLVYFYFTPNGNSVNDIIIESYAWSLLCLVGAVMSLHMFMKANTERNPIDLY